MTSSIRVKPESDFFRHIRETSLKTDWRPHPRGARDGLPGARLT
jgi:hypothetical protein